MECPGEQVQEWPYLGADEVQATPPPMTEELSAKSLYWSQTWVQILIQLTQEPWTSPYTFQPLFKNQF